MHLLVQRMWPVPPLGRSQQAEAPDISHSPGPMGPAYKAVRSDSLHAVGHKKWNIGQIIHELMLKIHDDALSELEIHGFCLEISHPVKF